MSLRSPISGLTSETTYLISILKRCTRSTAPHIKLISLAELWRINALGQKYCSLLEQRNTLSAAYTHLKVVDEYFEQTIMLKIDTVEMVTDITEWLSMKYKTNKQDAFDLQFHDDKDVANWKCKAPSHVSAYKITKKSVHQCKWCRHFGHVILTFPCQGFGIQPSEVVQNFVSCDRPNFVDDQELNPLTHAKQFINPDSTIPQTPDGLLCHTQMVLATELGKDPFLKQAM